MIYRVSRRWSHRSSSRRSNTRKTVESPVGIIGDASTNGDFPEFGDTFHAEPEAVFELRFVVFYDHAVFNILFNVPVRHIDILIKRLILSHIFITDSRLLHDAGAIFGTSVSVAITRLTRSE